MADKTIGALEEAPIGELPPLASLLDDTLIPVEQQGEARKMTGKQLRQYFGGTGGSGGSEPGPGVAPGGKAGQILAKRTAADYDTRWVDPPEGGGGEAPKNVITIPGGGSVTLNGDFGDPPYTIEIDEGPGGGGGSGGASSADEVSFTPDHNVTYSKNVQDALTEVSKQVYSTMNTVYDLSMLHKILKTKSWKGTLADGVEERIDFTRPFDDSLTFAPIVLFYLAVTFDGSWKSLDIYAGDTITATSGGGNAYSGYFLYALDDHGGLSYIRLNAKGEKNVSWYGNLGLKAVGSTARYEVKALFLNCGEQ